MIPSIYVVGGAATGKSTFVSALLQGRAFGPLIDLHMKPDSRGNRIVLRGHELDDGGLYIGHMRPEFPGTDGLNRASAITGQEWLENGGAKAYRYIVAEGITLSNRRFVTALHRHTDFMLVHLWCESFVKDLRCLERGSAQSPGFMKSSATRARNLWTELTADGVQTLSVDTADPALWDYALDVSRMLLWSETSGVTFR